MFYEIKEKRVKTGTQTKWWLTAAFSAVVITATFIGIIFWLGITVRQPESNFERHPTFREFQHKTVKPTTPPPIEYPTAEILKTTIKNKKGRIEMVDNGGEKLEKSTSKTTIVKTTREKNESPTDKSLELDMDDVYPESESPDVQLRSKIAKLSSTQLDYDEGAHLRDGINPLEEVSSVSGGENNSVKKKSEAVLPSWYDPNLQNNPSKPEPFNDLKQDTVYDLPDFSQIKPDLSAFNTKTIPAFTYLKEPLPQLDDIPPVSSESGTVDDSYYYQQQSTNAVPDHKDDNSLTAFLQKRLHNIHDWLLYGSKKNRTVDLTEIVKMVNNSIQTKNIGSIFTKLKDLYTGFNSSDMQNMPVSNLLYPTSPSILNNSTSLVSFGLLAIDLFLLHNVQQIVWNEESKIGEEMLKDPDVVALNALFMSPDRVQQMRQTNSRIFTDREKKGVVHDLLEFINGGLRAVLNLSKAYKNSVSRSNARSTSNGSTLDCIWTLYCRNLDKTAKLQGPYGFLAKMNR